MNLKATTKKSLAGYDFEQYSVWGSEMKSSMILASLALAAAAGAAQAGGDNINVGDTIRFFDRDGNLGGGEFGVAKLPASNIELFRTFCLQRNEYMDYNAAGFNVVGVSTQTVAGGVNLAAEVAYLYTMFRAGTLPGSAITDGSYGGGNHGTEADSLQRAIWSFMGQLNPNSAEVTSDVQAVALRNAASAAIASNSWSGIGNVRILNLTWATGRSGFGAGTDAQDQLVIIPLPTGAALGLAGLSLLAIRRRAAR